MKITLFQRVSPSGAARTPQSVATCLRRALVAARKQRRKRWQIWGWKAGAAIIAAAVGTIRAPYKMSRLARSVATKGIETIGRTRVAPPRSPPALEPLDLHR